MPSYKPKSEFWQKSRRMVGERLSQRYRRVEFEDLISQIIDLSGGPVATRTPDLYRVKVAL